MATLDIVILAVDEPNRAAAFYEVLGWTRRVDTPVYVELDAGAVRVGLYVRPSFAAHPGLAPAYRPAAGTTATELYIRVGDVDRAVAELRQAGATLLSDRALRPWGDEVAYLTDLDGNLLALAGAAPP